MAENKKIPELKQQDKAEQLLFKILLHNKLITHNQVRRLLKTREEEIVLPDEIKNRNLVKESLLEKACKAVEKKGHEFQAFLGNLDA